MIFRFLKGRKQTAIFFSYAVIGDILNKIEWIIHTCNQWVWGWGTIVVLIVSGLWSWFQNRCVLFHPFLILRGMRKTLSGPKGRQARHDFYTALAGTLGVGSIAGAASAMALGGAGALFWLLLSSLLGMGLKYAETILACAYQKRKADRWIGGAMILLGEVRNHPFLSVCFSLSCLLAAFGVGSMAPSGAICTSLQTIFPIQRWFAALLVVVFASFVLSGKGGRIQMVNAKIIPLISVMYILFCFYILIAYHERLPLAAAQVMQDAFCFSSFGSGVGGHMVNRAVHYGLTRGLFSHEAGMGSAPLAYASHPCKEPAEQGFLGMVEVFFDSFGITLLSALVLLCVSMGNTYVASDGTVWMRQCFRVVFGNTGGILFSVMMICFAFPTILGWYYYAGQCLQYLFSYKWIHYFYLLLYLCSLYAGGVLHTAVIWELSDTLNGCMLILNLCALWLFRKEMASLSALYRQKER